MKASVVRRDGTHAVDVDVQHGVDGWILTDMDWSPESGVAVYDYVQLDEHGKYVASACRIERQPCTSKHEGWSELWDRPVLVFTLE